MRFLVLVSDDGVIVPLCSWTSDICKLSAPLTTSSAAVHLKLTFRSERRRYDDDCEENPAKVCVAALTLDSEWLELANVTSPAAKRHYDTIITDKYQETHAESCV